MKILCLTNKNIGELHFIATPEGYVNYTVAQSLERYTYVYQYKDHLGNISMSWAKDPATQNLKILEENHYYPFGLKHQGYNYDRRAIVHRQQFRIDVAGPDEERFYEYKFQGQERQVELDLNWDSFKYRNYDYAVGRFMNFDKLAEDYYYQSPYNFSENRVVDGRELDGLEWRSSISSDGKTVNLELNVKTINSTNGIITNEQMSELAKDRVELLKSTVGGTDSLGRNVNVNVNFSDSATMIWEYTGTVDTSNSNPEDYDVDSKEKLQNIGNIAQGWTDTNGNSQVNRTQIGLNNIIDGWSSTGKFRFWDKKIRQNIAQIGVHEDGHTLGGFHEDDKRNTGQVKQIQMNDSNNLMNNGSVGTNLSGIQRALFIALIFSQQPQTMKYFILILIQIIFINCSVKKTFDDKISFLTDVNNIPFFKQINATEIDKSIILFTSGFENEKVKIISNEEVLYEDEISTANNVGLSGYNVINNKFNTEIIFPIKKIKITLKSKDLVKYKFIYIKFLNDKTYVEYSNKYKNFI